VRREGAATTRTLLITGATRGIGGALAAAAIAAGHTVHGCGRDRARISALAAAHGPPHSFEAVDVADDAAVAAWAARLRARGTVPDLIVNNAAVIADLAPLWRVPADRFSAVIDVNVKGVASVIRHFLPAMIERGRGVVVNLSSGWGRSVSPEVAPYCTSKYAIEGLTAALAADLEAGNHPLAAVALSPGVVDTDMLRVAFGAEGSARAVDPATWARAALPFLLGLGPKENGRSLTFER
jgi:NAD(P)-dependent dehydrogenase (short-subunit alcohol dehydrogenase family)